MIRATGWVGAVLLGWLAATASVPAASAATADDDAMQVMADVTAIDSECRDVNAVFGLVFAYGAAHGIATVDILPLGHRRAAFEAAFDRRIAGTPHEALCGPLLDGYRRDFPDWFTSR